MTGLFPRLKTNEQRGSKPRCHLLTHGSPRQVALRLTQLIEPWGQITATDHWMPRGFIDTSEAQLGKNDYLLAPDLGDLLINWWLAIPKGARVPHWDIASTCTVEGRSGLLLVEAKAHDEELINEEAGKKLAREETSGQTQNREHIHDRMQEASVGLTTSTKMDWALSIEHRYQMSNRFAWAWKLTELGLPVILVYLGFLNASEMHDRGKPFPDQEAWEKLVMSHSEPLFPSKVWNQRWIVNTETFIPMIKSVELPLVKS
ncbi:MAG: hypothetical protein HN407_05565 [Chloroflexi bacterium]|nr:hypothetical protein [Chloroflexota bacterium]